MNDQESPINNKILKLRARENHQKNHISINQETNKSNNYPEANPRDIQDRKLPRDKLSQQLIDGSLQEKYRNTNFQTGKNMRGLTPQGDQLQNPHTPNAKSPKSGTTPTQKETTCPRVKRLSLAKSLDQRVRSIQINNRTSRYFDVFSINNKADPEPRPRVNSEPKNIQTKSSQEKLIFREGWNTSGTENDQKTGRTRILNRMKSLK
ncbi:hypothetical protein C922_05702 [Plasmodium inui San Antonio 1]|uniref:Uncharacterized protein n=1 Tax=Plasmodium inui San Antonio 1 TaxID=1237626 RepID=W6ZSM2_9APIC|nr:hypothetical protein C922_05702 [Plasmodium inui San Antonio 1]EUD63917.1 hypothetical protein C922_05702 [Plasmodium inui San Antonio 1]